MRCIFLKKSIIYKLKSAAKILLKKIQVQKMKIIVIKKFNKFKILKFRAQKIISIYKKYNKLKIWVFKIE